MEPISQNFSDIIYSLQQIQIGNVALAQISDIRYIGGLIKAYKIFAYITVPILLFFFIYLTVKIIKLRNSALYLKNSSAYPAQKYGSTTFQGRWEEVLVHVESPREAEWKFAVIEADKLVEDALNTAGFSGDNMGERLMNIDKTRLLSIDGLWEAHKVRNRVAHEVNYFLRYTEARRAINLYTETLKELGAIS
jgi:hypothetical protein